MKIQDLREVTGRVRISPAMIQNAIGNKSQVLVEMPPMDFLRLTTVAGLEPVEKKTLSLLAYNRMVKRGEIVVHPFLRIRIEPDRAVVNGHEGRSRALAAMRAGVKLVPVALQLRPDNDYKPKMQPPTGADQRTFQFWEYMDPVYIMTSADLPLVVEGQFAERYVSTKNWKIVKDDLLAMYRRE